MFELDGYYRLSIQMTGASHTDDFDLAFRNEGLSWGGIPVTDFTSAQTAHDTLDNIAQGIIAGFLANNPGRWTSGSVTGTLRVPPSLTSV